MRRLPLTLTLTLAILLALGMLHVSPVAAACVAPTITFTPHDVDRGGEVTVVGEYWGGCYDTGSTPALGGSGAFTDIEIVLVQGSQEWVLATVDADDDLRLSADVVIPADTAPGDAQLIAQAADDGVPVLSEQGQDLSISFAPAITTTSSAPVPSSTTAVTSPKKAIDSPPTDPTVWWILAGAVVVAVAAGALVLRARNQKSHTSDRPK